MTGSFAEWVPIILDENRRVAYLDIEPAVDKAAFADDGFVVSVVRDSARPGGCGPAYTPQTAFMSRDVAYEVECSIQDPVDDQLSLRTHWSRARVAAAAFNAADWYVRDRAPQGETPGGGPC